MVRPRVYGTTFSSTKVHSAKLSSFRRSEVMTGEAIMAIRRVGVIGSGTMGNGIAHVLAQRGFNVVLCDVEQRFLDRALDTIAKNLDGEVAKNKIATGDKVCTLGRITAVVDRAKLVDCGLAIEAATEKFEIKAEIFRELDRMLKPEVILASNTSSISITKIGALTGRADKVIGMHFFNPVPVMKLVEEIRRLATSQATFETVREMGMNLILKPVEGHDALELVSYVLLVLLLSEAMYELM